MESFMGIKSEDIVPLNQVRARFTELAEEVRAGRTEQLVEQGSDLAKLIEQLLTS